MTAHEKAMKLSEVLKDWDKEIENLTANVVKESE